MAVVTDMDVARRIARAVVSDIALYNVKKVEEGIRNDSLFDLLKNEIEEGRNYYLSRIDPEIAKNSNPRAGSRPRPGRCTASRPGRCA